MSIKKAFLRRSSVILAILNAYKPVIKRNYTRLSLSKTIPTLQIWRNLAKHECKKPHTNTIYIQ